MNDNDDKTITLKIYGSVNEAEKAKEKLDLLGIACFISTDDCGGMRPYLQLTNGVRLIVLESDAEAAIKLLEGKENKKEGNT